MQRRSRASSVTTLVIAWCLHVLPASGREFRSTEHGYALEIPVGWVQATPNEEQRATARAADPGFEHDAVVLPYVNGTLQHFPRVSIKVFPYERLGFAVQVPRSEIRSVVAERLSVDPSTITENVDAESALFITGSRDLRLRGTWLYGHQVYAHYVSREDRTLLRTVGYFGREALVELEFVYAAGQTWASDLKLFRDLEAMAGSFAFDPPSAYLSEPPVSDTAANTIGSTELDQDAPEVDASDVPVGDWEFLTDTYPTASGTTIDGPGLGLDAPWAAGEPRESPGGSTSAGESRHEDPYSERRFVGFLLFACVVGTVAIIAVVGISRAPTSARKHGSETPGQGAAADPNLSRSHALVNNRPAAAGREAGTTVPNVAPKPVDLSAASSGARGHPTGDELGQGPVTISQACRLLTSTSPYRLTADGKAAGEAPRVAIEFLAPEAATKRLLSSPNFGIPGDETQAGLLRTALLENLAIAECKTLLGDRLYGAGRWKLGIRHFVSACAVRQTYVAAATGNQLGVVVYEHTGLRTQLEATDRP